LALEKELGEAKMWEWMKLLLQSPAVFTNYQFFEQTLEKVLKDKARLAKFREKYFGSERSLEHAIATLNIPSAEPAPAVAEKQVPKTYFYFFFSRPVTDIGSSQNRVIMHTEVLQMTCTPEEFSKIAKPIFKRIADECENEAGCTSDLNTYESLEKAQAALVRSHKHYNYHSLW
jgi:hypothetical protein